VSAARAAPAGSIRPAASLIVLRDGPGGVEVLLMRRPERGNDFRSGACVFPGGVVDAADAGARAWCFGLDEAAAGRRLGEAAGALDFFVAAVRECFEEAGLLFACAPDGGALELGARRDELHRWRTRLHRGEATIAELCAALDCRLDLRDMAYFAHWLTPTVRPKRFDTRFFARLTPPGQTAEPDFGEALELMWLTPDQALDPARGLKLLNVTQRTLHELHPSASAHAAYAAALARRGVQRILPRAVRTADGRERFVIPGLPAYDEVERLDPEGRGHVADALAPGDCTRLSPRLLRVAGARRHAYVVTDTTGTEAALVDADPDDPAQAQALADAAPPAVRWLLFTGAVDEAVAAALRQRWPGAHTLAVRDLAAGSGLAVGADMRLHALALGAGHGLLVAEDATLLAGDAAPDEAASVPGAVWIAGARGFLRRIAAPVDPATELPLAPLAPTSAGEPAAPAEAPASSGAG
jgi:8-oxo-dGTP pyrophosphatase MutT (NUDIX family)